MHKGLKYTDSVFYEVILTARYMRKMAEQVFKKLELKLTNEEFSVLDFLYKSDELLCQRDLAIKMLYNRANVGKILDGLEKTGYIKRTIGEKSNYPVKLVSLTDIGENVYLETVAQLIKIGQKAVDEISQSEADNMSLMLRKMRNVIAEIVDIDI